MTHIASPHFALAILITVLCPTSAASFNVIFVYILTFSRLCCLPPYFLSVATTTLDTALTTRRNLTVDKILTDPRTIVINRTIPNPPTIGRPRMTGSRYQDHIRTISGVPDAIATIQTVPKGRPVPGTWFTASKMSGKSWVERTIPVSRFIIHFTHSCNRI